MSTGSCVYFLTQQRAPTGKRRAAEGPHRKETRAPTIIVSFKLHHPLSLNLHFPHKMTEEIFWTVVFGLIATAIGLVTIWQNTRIVTIKREGERAER